MNLAEMRFIERYRRPLLSWLGLAAALLPANAMAAWVLPEQFDLTRRRVHTLSPLTQNLLASLTRPIEMTLLLPQEPRSAADRAFGQTAVAFRELAETYRQRQPSLVIREL